MNKLQALLSNWHTTGAAIAFVAAKILAKLGAIWLPQHKEQFDSTAEVIESAAVSYGFLMAGDAKPINGHQTVDPTPKTN